MNRPIIQAVREYIMEFPKLKDGCLLVDHLGGEPVEYTVEPVPCSPVYKKYVDGDCIKQFLFLFASREYYSADVNQNIENLSFYEEFSKWICDRNFNGILPDLGSECAALGIEILTGGYMPSADTNTARYQIQLRLIYEEE